MATIIEFKNVSKQYPEERMLALRGVTFSVQEGEFLCLIGASGCGKTTVLKLIAGLEAPTTGAIQKPENVSMAFQAGALFPWLSVFENAALGLRQKNMPKHEVANIVERELRTVGMLEMHDKYPADLSGGQRQRVGIARALAVDPAVLLLDEPFSALDPKTTSELHDDVLKIWHATKKTIVMVSHLIEEAVSLGDRVILMKEGKVDSEYQVTLPYPRRENQNFHDEVMKIRKEFFK